MTKRKYTFKRFGALFAVVLVLACACLPVFASEQTVDVDVDYDFSFMPNANFLDLEKFDRFSEATHGTILESVDAINGTVTFRVPSGYKGDSLFVTKSTLADMMPYIKEGDIIVVSADVVGSNFDGGFQLYNSWEWLQFGEPFQVTASMLKQRLCIYPFVSNSVALTEDKVVIFQNFRVNLFEAKPFMPYYNTPRYVNYLQGLYLDGFDTAYGELEDDFINANYLVTAANIDTGAGVQAVWLDETGKEVRGDVSLTGYPWNGYAFRTQYLHSSAYEKVSTVNKFVGYDIFFTTKLRGRNLLFDDFPLILYGDNLRVQLRMNVETASGTVVLTDLVDVDGTYIFEWEGRRLKKPDGTFYELSKDDVCRSVFMHVMNGNVAYTSSPYEFAFVVAAHDGFNEGYKEGQTVGTQDGYNKGFTEGEKQGLNSGFTDGQEKGYASGYKEGERVGYNKGFAKGSEDDGFFKLFTAAISAPITAITGLFNFEMMGVDLSGFVMSLITLCAVIAVIKVII